MLWRDYTINGHFQYIQPLHTRSGVSLAGQRCLPETASIVPAAYPIQAPALVFLAR